MNGLEVLRNSEKFFIDQSALEVISLADNATQAHISRRVFQKCDDKVRR